MSNFKIKEKLKLFGLAFLLRLPSFLFFCGVIGYTLYNIPLWLDIYFDIESERKFFDFLVQSQNKMMHTISWTNPQEVSAYVTTFTAKTIETAKLTALEKSLFLLKIFCKNILLLIWIITTWHFIKSVLQKYQSFVNEEKLIDKIVARLKKEIFSDK